MRSRALRAAALATACGLVMAACSKPADRNKGSGLASGATTVPDVQAPVGGDTATTAATETTGVTAPGATGGTVTAGGATPNVPASKGPTQTARPGAPKAPGSALTGGGDDSQARAVGERISPQSSQRRKPYYSGVGEDTIQLDFSYDATTCGVNVVSAITAAGGALPTQTRFYRSAPTSAEGVKAENEESVAIMVKYWNDHGFDAAAYAPKVRQAMGNDPKNQYYGRRLVYKMVDGGSNQCPDKTRAAATQAAEQDKAFIVFNNYDGAQYNMAANLNTVPANRRPMHFGTLWQSDQIYSKFAPFAWTQFATGSTITRQLASYICSRVRTGVVPARAPTVSDPKKRVFGLVHTNLQEDKVLVDEFKGYLKQSCNGDIITKEVEYEGTDFGKAQRDNPNVIAQLKLAGVTSVIMLTEPIQPLFQLSQAKSQNYFPEWIWSSFGYSDSNTVQRLYDKDETKGSIGTSNLGIPGGFGFGAGDPFAMWHTYHKTAPDGKPCDPSSDEGMSHGGNAEVQKYCKAPTSLVTWYYTMLPAIGGLLFAGPDLTPENVTKGLQAYPPTRYGGNGPTSDPRPALVGAGPGKHGFIVDAVEWRWRPDFTSPPPEKKPGWVEYPDCQRHYLQWPDNLAFGWEKNGPNYNAWCGDKNGYPRVLPEDSNK